MSVTGFEKQPLEFFQFACFKFAFFLNSLSRQAGRFSQTRHNGFLCLIDPCVGIIPQLEETAHHLKVRYSLPKDQCFGG